MWIWAVLGILAVLLGLFLYWAFVVTEGAYLGSRVVAWTYDLTARRYDGIKQFSPLDDAWLLAGPMLHALDGVDCPLVLDVATGTGRMPRALLKRPVFRGTVIGLDLSCKMLQEATRKLHEYPGRYALICRDAQDLPFPDGVFDAISCLEALEFMPSPKRVLNEMARVLRPGGVFLVTNRINWERKLMPGKTFAEPALRAILRDAGLVQIEFRPWQVYYDLIWARKQGHSSHLGKGTLDIAETLHCPRCQAWPLEHRQEGFACPACGAMYHSTKGIYLMAS